MWQMGLSQRATDARKRIVINLTSQVHDDRSCVAFTVGNAALAQGFDVAVFLDSDAVELSRKHACAQPQEPLDSLAELIDHFASSGGDIWVCSACLQHRGLSHSELIAGIVVTDASKMMEWIAEGAQVISY